MPQGDIRVAVPTEQATRKRRPIGLRDMLVTLAIVGLIVGVVFDLNLGQGRSEGSFVKLNPFSGILPAGPAPAIGQPAPEFQVPLLNGGTFKLNEHRGHPVWINFWATWCPPCRAEMPDIQKVWEDEQGSDLTLIAVDFAESRPTVEAFVERLGLTFPIGLDSTGTITADYRISGFPSHFLVDKNGILRDIRVGLMSEATMREKLELLRSY